MYVYYINECVTYHPNGADHLIVSTALTLAQTERKPVVVGGTDTDLLVMLIYRSSSDTDIHMLCHRNILQLYNTDELQLYVGDMKQHMMLVHAANVTLYRSHVYERQTYSSWSTT